MTDAVSLPAGVAILERGWLSSNNVVFSEGVTAVVDTGYVTHSSQTVALIGEALEGKPLELIVNTHLHSDHCGGNAALAGAYPQARTLIPPGQAEAVAAWDPDVLTYEATGQYCDRFWFHRLLEPGKRVVLGTSEWEICAAPGHDPHSVVLFEPVSRTLISADALWENGFGVVFPELDGEDAFALVGATLDLIEQLAPRVVIPGHGSPFAGDGRVASALSRARSRLEVFVQSPARHASHAMKVLIKFKLLDWQTVQLERLLSWASAMPYMRRVHSRFSPEASFDAWLLGLVSDLDRSGALRREGQMISNG